ncbi:MAG: efflux RND transporter periplasmic adaptor subunit [Saprospiraceae bacterium]|nr:efflux RND transporter periplasmic adaptor subunit [Saprospiraceae bacterium]
MRRINLLFISIPLLLLVLLVVTKNLNRSTSNFFGVAENQETQINLEHACSIDSIYVTEGQFVSKGALLLEVTRSALDFKMSELTHDISELLARDRLNIDDIKGDLERIRAQRAEKMGSIQARIKILESEQTLNQSLFLDLQSVPSTVSPTVESTPYLAKLQTLNDELRLAIEPLDVEIHRLEQELKIAAIPAQTQISKLEKEIDLYHREQEQLKIYAPSDGLIGSIHCHVGENIPSFNVLISFYEQNPNTVVAYVHESLSLEVKVGDSLAVSSSLHPDETCLGRVSGLGHRIVEIPERLRKIPEIKSYGREVLIEIPATNNFLQKEKVVLRRLNLPNASFFSLFLQPISFCFNW